VASVMKITVKAVFICYVISLNVIGPSSKDMAIVTILQTIIIKIVGSKNLCLIILNILALTGLSGQKNIARFGLD